MAEARAARGAPEGALPLVGIDCATRDRKMGLARGVLEGGTLRLREVVHGAPDVMAVLVPWLGGEGPHEARPALLAMDAPLGWPEPLARHLAEHRAGEPLDEEADHLFHRETDRVVWARTGKRPMEVGADRIARAARRAVNLLAELRAAAGLPLPLAWAPGAVPERPSVIEVYPATTLRARALPDTGYKGRRGTEARRELVAALARDGHLDPGGHEEALIASDDALDAALCLVAATDFLQGSVLAPDDEARARREGWIWARAAGTEAPTP